MQVMATMPRPRGCCTKHSPSSCPALMRPRAMLGCSCRGYCLHSMRFWVRSVSSSAYGNVGNLHALQAVVVQHHMCEFACWHAGRRLTTVAVVDDVSQTEAILAAAAGKAQGSGLRLWPLAQLRSGPPPPTRQQLHQAGVRDGAWQGKGHSAELSHACHDVCLHCLHALYPNSSCTRVACNVCVSR